MTEVVEQAAVDELGPVDYLVVEFPGSDFKGEIPGAKPEECGNYHDSDLAQAQWWAKRYVTKTLSNLDEAHTHYPALLN